MAQPQPQMPLMPARPSFPQQQHQQSPANSPQMPARPSFPQQQHQQSPANSPQTSFAMPPNKRLRTSPDPPSQPASPFPSQQLHPAISPGPTTPATPPTAAASPNYANIQPSGPPPPPPPPPPPAPVTFPSQYTNGGPPSIPLQHPSLKIPLPHGHPGLGGAAPAYVAPALPQQQQQQYATTNQQQYAPAHQHQQYTTPTQQYQPATPTQHYQPATPQQQYQTATQQYTNAMMAPIASPTPTPQGVMGPPTKPVEKPTKEYEYDVSDSLAGTGIDLRAEEQYLADLYAGSFSQDARTGLPANAPGGKSSFYGAGLANQPAKPVNGMGQDELAALEAERAWNEAALRLANIRSIELRDPFLTVSHVHYKADKIAKEHGLTLNLDLKNQQQYMGKMRAPHEFPQPTVTVSQKRGPDGVMVATTGSWIPQDAFLVDQLALLSIATKHRLRQMLEDANSVATTRQTTSDGKIPEEWADVAVPLKTGLDAIQEGESIVMSQANPLKRSLDASNAQTVISNGKVAQNNLAKAIRDAGANDRKVEEERLRKRQKRLNPETAGAATAGGGSRAGSVAPGTPGPDGGGGPLDAKAPSKKELKKGAAAARLAEASSTASANQTLNTLMSGMGGFGARKKNKKSYSWMTSSGGGSAPGTPRPGTMDLPGGPGSPAPSGGPGGSRAPEKTNLTQEGRYRLGSWREDAEKGKNIQLRDWVTVLEMDGLETRAVQEAYLKLDASNPK
ncbi:hypothetical protein QBC46DRAFT_166887 [Diplogelasinospora grovesii]|uniref:TBP-associated factor 4 n=1 Tax=Diplogelasinospora grovesii TaxID=303347 RepID=A0AAN6S9A6_9PEZI|nr:hypothetical protein QBC46DRAFT_166887 [Diplogelasinospora grovesii]